MTRLSTYEVHKLIKAAIPEATTVYERTHRGQITIEEYLDPSPNPLQKELYENKIRSGAV